MNQLIINNSILEIFIGDITNTEYEAIVIPTNSRLLPSGELRCNVLRKAGAKVQVECNHIINKIVQLPVGYSVITSGGNFTKYIIHANGPKPGQGNESKKLMITTWNSLKLADDANAVSLLYPPISKEMRGITSKLCAEAMLPTIRKYLLEKNRNLRNVSVCVETQSDYKEFEAVLESLANE